MLRVIVGLDQNIRSTKRDKLLPSTEVIYLDDLSSTVSELENYAFPSLFSLATPVVHAKYLIEQYSDQLTKDLLATIVASPTTFILEERNLPTAIIKTIEKAGGFVDVDKPARSSAKPSTIFTVTGALTAKSKKDRWLSYQQGLKDHPVEAIIGILYWKLRSLIDANPKDQSLKDLYTSLMKAHKEAWQKGFPLELAVERVILEQ